MSPAFFSTECSRVRILERQMVSIMSLPRMLIQFLVDYGLRRLQNIMATANQGFRPWSEYKSRSEHEVFMLDL